MNKGLIDAKVWATLSLLHFLISQGIGCHHMHEKGTILYQGYERVKNVQFFFTDMETDPEPVLCNIRVDSLFSYSSKTGGLTVPVVDGHAL